ncbi:MAG: hypothetical protein WAK08_25470 [Pseudolabrys sp.]
MPTIVAHHNITKGSKHWLTSPKRKELFGPLGITNIRTFVDPQNPNRVALMMDVPIGIGGRLATPPLPHHRAYGSRTTAVRPS